MRRPTFAPRVLLALTLALPLAAQAAAQAPARVVWLDLGPSPAVLTTDQAVAKIAQGNVRFVLFTAANQPDAGAVVVGLAGGALPPPADPLAELRTSLAAAYAADPDPDKAAHVKALADLYAAAAGQVGATDKKPADFLAAMKAAALGLMPASAVGKVRDATALYLNARLPRDPAAAWTDASRAAAATAFRALADVLGGLK